MEWCRLSKLSQLVSLFFCHSCFCHQRVRRRCASYVPTALGRAMNAEISWLSARTNCGGQERG